MIESIQKGLNVMTVIYEIFLPWQQLTPERGSEETNSNKIQLQIFCFSDGSVKCRCRNVDGSALRVQLDCSTEPFIWERGKFQCVS